MTRKSRKNQQAICYHLLNRGINRSLLFHHPSDYRFFSNLVAEAKKEFRAQIYHWAWMPNHYHILLQIPFPLLSKFSGQFQQRYAHYHHKTHGSSGFLWQGRFKSFAVEADLNLIRCGRYIERNPVRAQLCQDAADYKWSSAAFYCSSFLDGITDADPRYSVFPLPQSQRSNYRKSLSSHQIDDWMQKQWNRATPVTILGSASFTTKLRRKTGARFGPSRGRPRILLEAVDGK